MMDDAVNNNNVVNDSDELFREYKETKSVEVRNKIVSKYLYLSDILAKKFLNRGIDYEDIYQVASIALIKAVERFDPDKGVKFISFATPTIIGEIKRYFRDKGSVIRIPRRIYEVYQKINHARESLTQELKRPPRIDELARHLNISEESVVEIIESYNAYNIQSFSQNVYANDELELHEVIGDQDSTFERIENRDFLEKSLDKFSDVEKEFISMRYFDNKTQKDIAQKMGVSQMYISRLERKVLEKFRRMLAK
ncbi:MAG TPA: SigB/SigF/SigG family RNA polymerase sigma factor [Hungateiclostridium thermocellum]|jgi:RNA polymerase sigma-B factor|uniref:RNA polymerase, sigma 28 subunit, FliA/WhiG subfamily n=2 Tax=Acetivibrio thermocellus TaxID=1515 RepID=A3DJG9_ACET2|nr:SigB/SigF/SigG family RNA polymerase sigma factor [Acetivibrio thermocellus]CDG37391.1 RNA polymerase sigma 28 subunit [Acetivibrio thermocellus BC1]ABN54098.1 RNA polymerase, sigma 28 subunit, FliA/WhiG subfamily [Acetivibrio thermocellus ATCC 27405]ADU73530.1 RNA polymerase, sigma 28 subunit, Sig B/F/G subfamily [Acetivibrio thermocellus DSM 1313]ALX07452.1 RNA polymerase, sigma 28 subunit, Sig B/F/G subfamily [Acetivibrio thermocellus AD2]EIC04081.1 RNA polymerase sigma-70 factor, sigma-